MSVSPARTKRPSPPGVVVSPDVVRPRRRDEGLLRLSLHAPGNHRQTVDDRHLHNGLQQGALLLIRQNPLGQRAVDLDDVHRQVGQVVQAAVPHAEVVQRDMDARLPQPLQRLRRVVDGLDENALGDLQGDPVGGHAGRADQVQQMLRAVPPPAAAGRTG